jgi:hypothetical protein
MERKSAYTIRVLLEELKENFPGFKKGQIFETLKSIYPDEKTPQNKRNIKLSGKVFTKPLALSRRDKMFLQKENSKLSDFFKDRTHGDFIEAIEIKENEVKCINLSLTEDVIDKYYKNELITISFDDIANGTIKPFRRKVDKYLNKIGGKNG